MRAFQQFGLVAAGILAAGTTAPVVEIRNEHTLSPEAIRPDRKTIPRLRSKHAGNKSGHTPHQGIGEIARRKRQIAAGQLRSANGLAA